MGFSCYQMGFTSSKTPAHAISVCFQILRQDSLFISVCYGSIPVAVVPIKNATLDIYLGAFGLPCAGSRAGYVGGAFAAPPEARVEAH